jgi:hypothetical protein
MMQRTFGAGHALAITLRGVVFVGYVRNSAGDYSATSDDSGAGLNDWSAR